MGGQGAAATGLWPNFWPVPPLSTTAPVMWGNTAAAAAALAAKAWAAPPRPLAAALQRSAVLLALRAVRTVGPGARRRVTAAGHAWVGGRELARASTPLLSTSAAPCPPCPPQQRRAHSSSSSSSGASSGGGAKPSFGSAAGPRNISLFDGDVVHTTSGWDAIRGSSKVHLLEFDDAGHAKRLHVSREELLAQLKLSSKDLRIVDGTSLNRHPGIFPREESIIVNFDQTARLVIQANRVLMIDPGTLAGERLARLLSDSLARPSEDARDIINSSFVYKALDAVLSFESAEFDYRLNLLTNSVSTILSRISENANDDALQRLLPLKANLAAFDTQIEEFKEALDDFAEDPEHIKRLQFTLAGDALRKAEAEGVAWRFAHAKGAADGGATADDDRDDDAWDEDDITQTFFDDFVYIADEIDNEASELMTNIRSAEEVWHSEGGRERRGRRRESVCVWVCARAVCVVCVSVLASEKEGGRVGGWVCARARLWIFSCLVCAWVRCGHGMVPGGVWCRGEGSSRHLTMHDSVLERRVCQVLSIELDRSRNRLLNLNLFATTGAFVVGPGQETGSNEQYTQWVTTLISSAHRHVLRARVGGPSIVRADAQMKSTCGPLIRY